MKRNLRRVGRLISIFYPRNIYKILAFFYSISLQKNRTTELTEIIEEKKYLTFLEIGVWRGDNILEIAKRLPHVRCYGVDLYDFKEYNNQISDKDDKSLLLKTESESVFQKAKAFENIYKNFELIRKSSVEASSRFENESLDLVFIDANHSYENVKKDIEVWLPKVKTGGILSGHDYSIGFFGVIQAVNEKLGPDNIYTRSDATWFYPKTK